MKHFICHWALYVFYWFISKINKEDPEEKRLREFWQEVKENDNN